MESCVLVNVIFFLTNLNKNEMEFLNLNIISNFLYALLANRFSSELAIYLLLIFCLFGGMALGYKEAKDKYKK